MAENTRTYAEGVEIQAPIPDEFAEILTPEAVAFVAMLAREFGGRVDEILERRQERQERISAGEMPDFLPETREIREGDWKIAPIPGALQDRRVEITGPPDRKMLINALNCGAPTYMTDFEDANCPTWQNMLDSQLNLRDAIDRTITFDDPSSGKHYALNDEVARPDRTPPRLAPVREAHAGRRQARSRRASSTSACTSSTTPQNLLDLGHGPYFYLPKMESHLEARLWNDIFVRAQDELGLPQGTIKATVLIETIMATFEMHEILYELREHSAGLNCGRWDYIFSYIKKFREQDMLLPDRNSVTMTVPFMRAYSLLTIKTCHKRGAHAIGGMAAQIPVQRRPGVDEVANNKVRERQGARGEGRPRRDLGRPPRHGRRSPKRSSTSTCRSRTSSTSSATTWTRPPRTSWRSREGPITMDGFRNNVSVGIQYLGAWLAGRGAVPVFNLMEDAATAEISRAQVWQWIHHPQGILEDGTEVTAELFREVLQEELEKIKTDIVGPERWEQDEFGNAAELFARISTDDEFVEFLTLPGYEYLD